jgi:hypothetical protein
MSKMKNTFLKNISTYIPPQKPGIETIVYRYEPADLDSTIKGAWF